MVEALIALGSNVGDRLGNLQEAVRRLSREAEVTATSGVYETAPMYVEDQPAFLNAAALVVTGLSPMALLATLKRIEADIGRERRARFGPREIDLDLIAYGRLEYAYSADGAERLRVPHPRSAERRFVLAPLADLCPDLELPGLGPLADMLRATADQEKLVRRLDDAALPL